MSRAIVELRKLLGDSQQDLSNRLGLALNTITRYEMGRDPSEEALREFSTLAAVNGNRQLANFFGRQYILKMAGRPESRLTTAQPTASEPAIGYLTQKLIGKEVDLGRTFMFAIAALRGSDSSTKASILAAFDAMARAIQGKTGGVDLQKVPASLSISPGNLVILPDDPVDESPKPAKKRSK